MQAREIFAKRLRLAFGSSSSFVLGREDANEKGREGQGPDPAGDRKGTPLLETAVSQQGGVGEVLHLHGGMEPSTCFSSGTILDEEPTDWTVWTGVLSEREVLLGDKGRAARSSDNDMRLLSEW